MDVQRDGIGAVPASDRANKWASIIASAYFPLDIRFRSPEGFQGVMERRQIGPVLLTHLDSEACEYERTHDHTRGLQTGEFLIAMPFASAVRFRQLGRDILCNPGSFFLENGDEPYRFTYDRPNSLCAMKVSYQALNDRIRQPDRLCALNVDGSEGVGALLIETIRRAHTMQLDDAAAEVIGRHIIEMLALALDRHAEISLSASSLVRAAHLRRAESLIRQRLGDSTLDPQAVARGCGISLRYLHSIFADTGRTVSQCIREERLRAARDMLEMPGMMKMADVAYRFGFADQAIFSRQFRARYGVSPSEFRAANRSGPTDRPIAS